MANTRRNRINRNVSKLFAVTRLTPKRIVLSNRPCEVLKPVRNTNATQPLSEAKRERNLTSNISIV